MLHRALLVFACASSSVGCGGDQQIWGQPAEDPPDLVTPEPIDPLVCDYCVGTAPATFTGPSNFWRGKLGFAPACKDPTPLQGIEGVLVEPSDHVQFVRECRITPSDTCPTEGQVCAPLPDADYQTCVHHPGRVDCPVEYSIHQEAVFLEGEEPFVFTLCCMAAPVPG
jgi:hypothetical protein